MNTFDYEYRVIYRDTDKMGITYYANYFVWFEAARTEYFRELGFPYTECEKKGYFLPVVETGAKYLEPSRYDDLLIIRASVSQIRKSSLSFEYQVFNKMNRHVLATGYSSHVFVNGEMKPMRVPEEIKRLVSVHKLLPEEHPEGPRDMP